MTAIPVRSKIPHTTKSWPADVWEFATQRGIAVYLDPILEATKVVFPTARLIEVRVERDPEFSTDDGILFLIHVPTADVPDVIGAFRAWNKETLRFCPAPQICNFLLRLKREEA
jgi:hypothetical protein